MKKSSLPAAVFVIVLVFSMVFSLPASAASSAVIPASANLSQAVVDESSSGTSLNMKVNEELTISLSSNPSTAFSWYLVEIGDAAVLERISDYYLPPESGGLGSSGTEIWTFRTLQPGTTSLSLEYRTPWSTTPVRTFNLSIRVTLPVPASSGLSTALLAGGLSGLSAFLIWRRYQPGGQRR